ncbi:hypothetical protein JCM10908_007178 [Rhodotorula pacifica]|uniref:uncharacterized protein n=1 Tax=Rhodotorula pacifica TaxID=1495444 RepID=UPI00317F1E0F
MAYNSPGSPHLHSIPLRPPFRSESSHTSPSVSPTNTTASRFHAALESMPSRHAYHASISSETSDEGPGHALAARDSYLPNGNRMFDTLQRELSLKEGLAALASPNESQDFDARPFAPFGPPTDEGNSDELGTLRGLPRSRREYLNGSRMLRGPSQDNLVTFGDNSGTRSGDRTNEGADPAPYPAAPPIPLVPSGDSLNELSSSTDGVRSRERRAGERVFPAPLLLRSDRSYSPSSGGAPTSTSATAYLPPTAPLSFQRRPSASHVSGSDTAQPREWIRRDVSNGSASLSASTRSALPYQNHRQQQSSTSSISYGSSLPYSTSPSYDSRIQPSAVGLSISTSPTSYTRSAIASITPPSSTLPTPSTTSSALPPLSASTSHAQSSSATPEGAITAQALLLHIHSLRSAASPMTLTRSLGPSTRPVESLAANPTTTHQRGRSTEAGSSPSDPDPMSASMSAATAGPSADRALSASTGAYPPAKLDTVDLSHKRIADVPLEVVDELKYEVEKLALGYNLLRDLPPHFAQLGNRLKYLNIRVNLLTTFPAVLCEMPSLEILDISRNKIRKLPAVPGTLVRLKVFSIAKNRVKRLPVWFTAMTQLKVLKLDHNPLEWPPRDVSTFPGTADGQTLSKQEEADEMQRWLPMLMRWMRDNRERELERDRDRELDRRRMPLDGANDSPNGLSIDLQRLGLGDRPDQVPELPHQATASDVRPEPTRPNGLEPVPAADADSAARHSRGSSLSTAEQSLSAVRPSLKAKKSLPDLRQSHATILAERRTGTSLEDYPPQPEVPAQYQPMRSLAEEPVDTSGPPSSESPAPASAEADVEETVSRPAPAHALARSYSEQPALRLDPASVALPSPITRKGTAPPELVESRDIAHGTAHDNLEAVVNSDNERNSGAYFRRQSMLPVSTISKTVPTPLLDWIETVRGILFSISQVHAALRQFVVYAAQERLAGPVSRLMGTSDASTTALINALDRFDSLSHRGTPAPHIIREVFTSCQQSVDLLRTLIDALQAPLRGLTSTADLRYTRTLLLMLFGSIGEIAQAWATIAPSAEEPDHPEVATLVLQPPTPSASEEAPIRLPESGVRLTRQRSVTRRHAGSFSVEDVEMGANLPPAIVPPLPPMPGGPLMLDEQAAAREANLGGSTVRARPTLASRRPSAANAAVAPITVPPPLAYEAMVQKAFEQPMTPGGIGLFERAGMPRQESYSGPDVPPVPAIPPSAMTSLAAPGPSSANPHRMSRPVSTLNADETFIDQADSTISIASDVYGMLLDSFEDPALSAQFAEIGKRRLRELIDLCQAGNETTVRLEQAVERVRGDDGRGRLKFTLADARKLGDASFDFVQNVIRSAKLIKTISQDFAFPLQMREAVGQLTLGTREFARLLSHAQTSFRPTQVVERGGSGSGALRERPQEGNSFAAREG